MRRGLYEFRQKQTHSFFLDIHSRSMYIFVIISTREGDNVAKTQEITESESEWEDISEKK